MKRKQWRKKKAEKFVKRKSKTKVNSLVMAWSARASLCRALIYKECRRNIMSTRPNMEKALEELQGNPYFEKYAKKIAVLQQTSPQEFLERVEHTRKAKEHETKKSLGSVDTSKYSSVLNPKEPLNQKVSGQDKKLDDVMRVELVQDKSAAEVQELWEAHHRSMDVIAATIPSQTYTQVYECTKKNPVFIFPLPREQGYEFIMSQCWGHSVHFTPLLAYQVHKENAPECLTMVHYTDLSEEKGIVLMRGEYDKKVVSGREAQCLANQFQLYYGGRSAERSELLRAFTSSPHSFRHMDLVRQLENTPLASTLDPLA